MYSPSRRDVSYFCCSRWYLPLHPDTHTKSNRLCFSVALSHKITNARTLIVLGVVSLRYCHGTIAKILKSVGSLCFHLSAIILSHFYYEKCVAPVLCCLVSVNIINTMILRLCLGFQQGAINFPSSRTQKYFITFLFFSHLHCGFIQQPEEENK